jgi:hypothetical protein
MVMYGRCDHQRIVATVTSQKTVNASQADTLSNKVQENKTDFSPTRMHYFVGYTSRKHRCLFSRDLADAQRGPVKVNKFE